MFNLKAIHLIVAEILQSGPKWWAEQLTYQLVLLTAGELYSHLELPVDKIRRDTCKHTDRGRGNATDKR